MTNAENPIFRPEENRDLRRAVRVFAVAPISVDKLDLELQTKHIDDIPLVEVIVGKNLIAARARTVSSHSEGALNPVSLWKKRLSGNLDRKVR